MAEIHENNVQWYTGYDTVTASFSQMKFVNKFKKYVKDRDDVQLVAQNKDGSICVKFPLKWVKISPPPATRQISDEEKARLRERLESGKNRKKAEEKAGGEASGNSI